MLSIKELSFQYQNKLIFENAQVEFHDTSLVCFHGKSGCGKTTLLKILTFDLMLDSGIIQYNHENISQDNAQDFLFNHVTYIDQGGTCFHNMTLYQHFEFYAKLHGIMLDEMLIEKYLKLVRLESINLKKYPSYLSTGQRKRFILAVGLMIGKDILLVDEPTASLDSANKKELIQTLKEVSKHCLVICTSHDDQLLSHADEIYEIKDYAFVQEKKNCLMSQILSSKKELKPNQIKYFKYKNRKLKSLYICLLIFCCAFSFLIPFVINLNANLLNNVKKQQNTIQSTGLIFYKLTDIRGKGFGISNSDFLLAGDLEAISNIDGVKSIVPHYYILDGKSREKNGSMQWIDPDGTKHQKSYYWPELSKKYSIDYFADIAIVSYAPEQNIMIDGKKIEGIYIDEYFQEILGETISGYEKLSLNFSFPVKYVTSIDSSDSQFYSERFEDHELTLDIDGVLPDNIYSDTNGGEVRDRNYVRIYMPVDQVQNLLKQYAQDKRVYNDPKEYLILCEDGKKDQVKMDIENMNELYQARYQIEGIQISTHTQSSSQYLVIFICGTMVLCFAILSYYYLYSRKKEITILRHEGLEKEIKNYLIRDYWYICIFSFIATTVSCVCFMLMFQYEDIEMIKFCLYWGLASVLIIIFIMIMGYHGICLLTKRKKL